MLQLLVFAEVLALNISSPSLQSVYFDGRKIELVSNNLY